MAAAASVSGSKLSQQMQELEIQEDRKKQNTVRLESTLSDLDKKKFAKIGEVGMSIFDILKEVDIIKTLNPKKSIIIIIEERFNPSYCCQEGSLSTKVRHFSYMEDADTISNRRILGIFKRNLTRNFQSVILHCAPKNILKEYAFEKAR
ncbi:MAG: hypothetical protein K1060chlam5_01266 [Candidatus Anoxychlamydiales bacterium]|nr:hypothetical protein [Candidatus Anoxychlamydiales bacterium]